MHCAGGYRSVIANSILKKHGIHNAIEVLGDIMLLRKLMHLELTSSALTLYDLKVYS